MVAIWVELSPVAGVGAFGVPVKVGLAFGAKLSVIECTNAVVAIRVELFEELCVGAVGFPVKAGLAFGASKSVILCTHAVVATLVELSLAELTFGAVTELPVNANVA